MFRQFMKLPDLLLKQGDTQTSLMTVIKSESEIKALLVILRKTTGFNRVSDKISYSQFRELTGLGRKALVDGIQRLEKNGFIKIIRSTTNKLKATNTYVLTDKLPNANELTDQFTRLPCCFIDRGFLRVLNRAEILVFLYILKETKGNNYLVKHQGDTGAVKISIRTFKKYTGLSFQAITTAIKTLSERGLILKIDAEEYEDSTGINDIAFNYEHEYYPEDLDPHYDYDALLNDWKSHYFRINYSFICFLLNYPRPIMVNEGVYKAYEMELKSRQFDEVIEIDTVGQGVNNRTTPFQLANYSVLTIEPLLFQQSNYPRSNNRTYNKCLIDTSTDKLIDTFSDTSTQKALTPYVLNLDKRNRTELIQKKESDYYIDYEIQSDCKFTLTRNTKVIIDNLEVEDLTQLIRLSSECDNYKLDALKLIDNLKNIVGTVNIYVEEHCNQFRQAQYSVADLLSTLLSVIKAKANTDNLNEFNPYTVKPDFFFYELSIRASTERFKINSQNRQSEQTGMKSLNNLFNFRQ